MEENQTLNGSWMSADIQEGEENYAEYVVVEGKYLHDNKDYL